MQLKTLISVHEIKKIAEGGMAEIFLAKQLSLDRFVVIKKLKEHLKNNSDILERFRREAYALSSLLHQNLAHIYDYDEQSLSIVMEYIPGIDLSLVIQKIGRLPEDVSSLILLSVARGIEFIHHRNLIHRDIKPSNIRISDHGEIKLMDFGIAVSIQEPGLTEPGMVVGSPYYLSPEQIKGEELTEKTDLFLLGITFYEMLTGVKPFVEKPSQTVFQIISEGKFIPLKKRVSKISPSLERMVNRLLKTNPHERYPSVRHFIMDLENFLGPQKIHHTSNILLDFLDREGLLKPAIVIQPSDVQAFSPKFTVRFLLVGFFLLLLGFLMGRMTVKNYLEISKTQKSISR